MPWSWPSSGSTGPGPWSASPAWAARWRPFPVVPSAGGGGPLPPPPAGG